MVEAAIGYESCEGQVRGYGGLMPGFHQTLPQARERCDVPTRTGGDDQYPHVMILLGKRCPGRPGARTAAVAVDANGSCAVEVQPAVRHGIHGENTVGIGEPAARTGLPVKTIRCYSDIGLLPESGRSRGGHRRYTADALSRLRLIQRLRAPRPPLRTVRGRR